MWKHTCPDDGGRVFGMGSPFCNRCGGLGEYDGWHYRMHEAMAGYQTLYGLKPIGAHRLEAVSSDCRSLSFALLAAAPSGEEAQRMANSVLEGIRDIEGDHSVFPHVGGTPRRKPWSGDPFHQACSGDCRDSPPGARCLSGRRCLGSLARREGRREGSMSSVYRRGW
jgi:hypothetical protein